jgi:hypothetical protein
MGKTEAGRRVPYVEKQMRLSRFGRFLCMPPAAVVREVSINYARLDTLDVLREAGPH